MMNIVCRSKSIPPCLKIPLCKVSLDGFYAVHGIKVCEGEKGRFVSMPSTQYTNRDGNKQYQNIFHPISKAARNALNQAVLNAYDIKLQQVQATEIKVKNTPDEPRMSI